MLSQTSKQTDRRAYAHRHGERERERKRAREREKLITHIEAATTAGKRELYSVQTTMLL